MDLSKILTCSAEAYCKSKGKKLEDYELVGVHLESPGKYKIHEKFGNQIPQQTEVVTDFKYSCGGRRWDGCGFQYNRSVIELFHILSGTALIPKEKV